MSEAQRRFLYRVGEQQYIFHSTCFIFVLWSAHTFIFYKKYCEIKTEPGRNLFMNFSKTSFALLIHSLIKYTIHLIYLIFHKFDNYCVFAYFSIENVKFPNEVRVRVVCFWRMHISLKISTENMTETNELLINKWILYKLHRNNVTHLSIVTSILVGTHCSVPGITVIT